MRDRKEYTKAYYQKNKGIIKQRQVANKEKLKEYRKIYQPLYYQKNKDSFREYVLKKKFGLTIALYEEMLSKQDFKCAICGVRSEDNKDFVVDHDHATGKVRALLCRYCNIGLGHFRDNTETLTKAIAYLNEFKKTI